MPNQTSSAVSEARGAKDAALDVLDEHWADADGVVTFPVDPVQIAQKLGAKVSLADLDGDVAGLLVRREEAGALQILLNRADHKNRQRFTCAHEIGHIIRRAGSRAPLGFVEYRNELSSLGTDPEEKFANRFAAELLMPASAVRKLWSDGLRVPKMARVFNVSEEAMENRLTFLGLAAS